MSVSRAPLIVALALLGCGKKDAAGGKPSELAESAAKDIADVKAAIAVKNTNRAYAVCSVANTSMLRLRSAEPALAAELTKLCTREVPLVEMTRALERLEEARKLKPTGPIMECTGLKSYKKPLEKGGYGADPEVVALETRWTTACPK